eukprot:3172454-Rhodomonas_salina.2
MLSRACSAAPPCFPPPRPLQNNAAKSNWGQHLTEPSCCARVLAADHKAAQQLCSCACMQKSRHKG